jgi:hypothetical protein
MVKVSALPAFEGTIVPFSMLKPNATAEFARYCGVCCPLH